MRFVLKQFHFLILRFRDHLELREWAVSPVDLAKMESRDQTDFPEIPEAKENPELRVDPDQEVWPFFRSWADVSLQDRLDFRDQWDQMESQEFLGHKGHLGKL